jgi:hypothetical protein
MESATRGRSAAAVDDVGDGRPFPDPPPPHGKETSSPAGPGQLALLRLSFSASVSFQGENLATIYAFSLSECFFALPRRLHIVSYVFVTECASCSKMQEKIGDLAIRVMLYLSSLANLI